MLNRLRIGRTNFFIIQCGYAQFGESRLVLCLCVIKRYLGMIVASNLCGFDAVLGNGLVQADLIGSKLALVITGLR